MSIGSWIYITSVIVTLILFIIIERRHSDLRLKDLFLLFIVSLLSVISLAIYVIANYNDVVIVPKKKYKEVSTLTSELNNCKKKIKEMEDMLKEFTK